MVKVCKLAASCSVTTDYRTAIATHFIVKHIKYGTINYSVDW